jgi:GNAT superfamily N-acetyltransferase
MTVLHLPPSQAALAATVLCAAFADYPVMRYVLGSVTGYAERLRSLIGFFVAARYLRGDAVLGILDPEGRPLAAALLTLPSDLPPPPELTDRREAVWQELGSQERGRYETYGALAGELLTGLEPHHHLNMIGVDPSQVGHGLARRLLEHAHALARADPRSSGVSLTTETDQNRAFYRYFGYHEIGHARVSPDLETWAFFRPHSPAVGT